MDDALSVRSAGPAGVRLRAARTAFASAALRPLIWRAAVLAASGLVLFAISRRSYLLFHLVAELAAIVFAFSLFVIVWHAKDRLESGTVLLLGVGYGGVGAIDVAHALAYRGMNVFDGATTDLPTQLWIGGRYLETATLVVAPLLVRMRPRPLVVAPAVAAVTFALFAAPFAGLFPSCFVEGSGLTAFKIATEWVLAGLFAASFVLFRGRRRFFDQRVLQLVCASLAMRVGSELAFTLYDDPYALWNFLGHFLKLFGTYLMYKGVLETALVQPMSILYRELKQREEDLREANVELEAFSYSVSHDLRAPARQIAGFSTALLEDVGGALPPEPSDILRRIAAASGRMTDRIDALLALSKVTRAGLSPVDVDLGALARSVVEELREREPGRDVEVVIAPDLRGRADPHLMRAALENLLGNAWKFTARTAGARIEVGRSGTGPGAAFFVRDNGAGFPSAYADRLFAPFQRLHAADEFPGTGIGLATVHRIVRRHGGRVWAEGAPGRGATFHFTL